MRSRADIDQNVFLRSHAKRDSKLTYLTALGMIDQIAADVSGVQAPDGAGAHLACERGFLLARASSPHPRPARRQSRE
jgi:hypothetical protein